VISIIEGIRDCSVTGVIVSPPGKIYIMLDVSFSRMVDSAILRVEMSPRPTLIVEDISKVPRVDVSVGKYS